MSGVRIKPTTPPIGGVPFTAFRAALTSESRLVVSPLLGEIDPWRDHLHTWPTGVPEAERRCFRCGLKRRDLFPPPLGRPLSSHDPAMRKREGGPHWWGLIPAVLLGGGMILIVAMNGVR